MQGVGLKRVSACRGGTIFGRVREAVGHRGCYALRGAKEACLELVNNVRWGGMSFCGWNTGNFLRAQGTHSHCAPHISAVDCGFTDETRRKRGRTRRTSTIWKRPGESHTQT